MEYNMGCDGSVGVAVTVTVHVTVHVTAQRDTVGLNAPMVDCTTAPTNNTVQLRSGRCLLGCGRVGSGKAAGLRMAPCTERIRIVQA